MTGPGMVSLGQRVNFWIEDALGALVRSPVGTRLRRWGVTGKALGTSVPYLWLLLFFLIPFVIVLKISFSDAQIAMPPYEQVADHAWLPGLTHYDLGSVDNESCRVEAAADTGGQFDGASGGCYCCIFEP